ncbi:MAG: alanine--tRNA ligase-related protein [Patescibacteria group bacterium]
MSNDYYIIADHIKAACFIIASGVEPSGKQRGYILRRLIRRSFSASLRLDIDISNPQYFEELVESVITIYQGVYNEVEDNKIKILEVLNTEASKYQKSILVGEKEWRKILDKESLNNTALAQKTWDLYQTHGVPIEASEGIILNRDLNYDHNYLNKLIKDHQKLSQTKSAGQFKSGLGEDNQKTRKLHTVTHILHTVLISIYGKQIKQKGSAITSQKARFDFTLDSKIEPQDMEQIEKQVQKIIDLNLNMTKQEMTEPEARELGAIGLFGEKYGERVTVYSLKDSSDQVYSREFCGGPHIENTKQIGSFKILKQKSVGQGLRRLEFDVI